MFRALTGSQIWVAKHEVKQPDLTDVEQPLTAAQAGAARAATLVRKPAEGRRTLAERLAGELR